MSLVNPIITVNNDAEHTATLSVNVFGRQSESGLLIAVNLPPQLAELGYDGYIDFLQPNGLAYFKGPYDTDSGTMLVSIGETDTILDHDGLLGWQVVLREGVLDRWKTRMYQVKVEKSINARTSALAPVVPPLEAPDPYPAANVGIQDAGGYYASAQVEDALQEVGIEFDETAVAIAEVDGRVDLVQAGGDTDGRFSSMPYVGTAPLIERGGTDTNGYIKHANGSLECFVGLSGLDTASTGTKEITWTFAHAFAAGTIPIVTASIGLSTHTQFSIIDKVAVQRASEGNNTTAKLFYNVAATSAVAFRIHARAIGRWK